MLYMKDQKLTTEELQEKYNNSNWIDAMLEREALPKGARPETVQQFIRDWGIPESTYYYNLNKLENQKKIVEIAVREAKKKAPTILMKLGEKAEDGDNKSMEMYLDYILKLSKNLDITTGGEPLYLPSEIINKYEDSSTPSPETDS